MNIQQYMIERLQTLMNETEGIRESVEHIANHPYGYFQSTMGSKFVEIAREVIRGEGK
jgi:hypothetical protein